MVVVLYYCSSLVAWALVSLGERVLSSTFLPGLRVTVVVVVRCQAMTRREGCDS